MQDPNKAPFPRSQGLLASFYDRIREVKENFLMDVEAILEDLDELTEIEIRKGKSIKILRDDDLEPLDIVIVGKEYPDSSMLFEKEKAGIGEIIRQDIKTPQLQSGYVVFSHEKWNDLNTRIHALANDLKTIGQDFWPGPQPVTVRHVMEGRDEHQAQG